MKRVMCHAATARGGAITLPHAKHERALAICNFALGRLDARRGHIGVDAGKARNIGCRASGLAAPGGASRHELKRDGRPLRCAKPRVYGLNGSPAGLTKPLALRPFMGTARCGKNSR
jgi:hypothetical protein